MNTRITCLLLFVIAHASATAAPKFPVRLDAAIEIIRNGLARGTGTVGSLTWSPDGKTLASNGIESKFNDRGKEESIQQLLLWDAVKWSKEPKERILVNNGDGVIELDFFDPNDSNRLALQFADRAQERFMYGILNLKRHKDKPRIIGQELKLQNFTSSTGQSIRSSATWSSDGKKVAFNTFDDGGSVISIFDGISRKALHTLNSRNARDVLSPGRRDFGLVAGWSPAGKYLITNTEKGLVVFDGNLEEELFRFDQFPPNYRNFRRQFGIISLGWNPKGAAIAFCDGLGNLHFLDLKDLEENEDPIGAPSRLKKTKADVSLPMKDRKGNPIPSPRMLAWGPEGRRIAVISMSREKLSPPLGKGFFPAIFIYSKGGALQNNFVVKDVFTHPDDRNPGVVYINTLKWSPDGFMLAAGLSDGTIRVFKTPK